MEENEPRCQVQHVKDTGWVSRYGELGSHGKRQIIKDEGIITAKFSEIHHAPAVAEENIKYEKTIDNIRRKKDTDCKILPSKI